MDSDSDGKKDNNKWSDEQTVRLIVKQSRERAHSALKTLDSRETGKPEKMKEVCKTGQCSEKE